MNAINVIKPYKWEGMWVFDDEKVGLVKEPFVEDASQMIETVLALKKVKNAENGFLLLFSDKQFKGADIVVEWVKYEEGGDVYRFVGEGLPLIEGWFCPALRLYYQDAPAKIYLQVRESEIGQENVNGNER